MEPALLEQWASIAEIVGGLTSSALLAIGLYLFYNGKLLSRKNVDEIKEHSEAQTKLFAAEISKSIIAAVKELNGGGDG